MLLRRYVAADAGAMYKNWASDKEVTKYLTWPAHSSQEVSRSVIEDWINRYSNIEYYHWAIVWKENGDEPIGDIAVNYMNEHSSTAQIGYCIGRLWWHKGIMSEALQAVMNFLFDVVDVKRIEARHDPRNPNSGKVMKKCGMKYEGTLRSSDWNNQGICDACYYALLQSERRQEPSALKLTEVNESHRSLLWNIFQKYFYEMTNYYDNNLDSQGNYEYPYFDRYFTEPARKAFLIYDHETLVGFAMVNPYSCIQEHPDFTLAEFTIFPRYRRKRLGYLAAEQLFYSCKGTWEIKYNERNTGAKTLWNQVTKQFHPIVRRYGESEIVLSFCTGRKEEKNVPDHV